MVDFVFNIALGRGVEWYNRVENNDPANSAFIVILFTGAITQATLQDLDDIAAIEADAGAAEATFTGYVRKVLTDAELAALPAPDDANNRYDVDLPNQSYAPTTTQVVEWAVVAYDSDTIGGTDANIIPWLGFDVDITTDNAFDLKFNAAGAMRAQPV